MTGKLEEMLSKIDPADADKVREFQDYLRIVKINKELRQRVADLENEIAILRQSGNND